MHGIILFCKFILLPAVPWPLHARPCYLRLVGAAPLVWAWPVTGWKPFYSYKECGEDRKPKTKHKMFFKNTGAVVVVVVVVVKSCCGPWCR